MNEPLRISNPESKKSFSPASDRFGNPKNLTAIIIILIGLFIGSLFVDSVQLFTGQGFSMRALRASSVVETADKTWVAYDEPIVDMMVITPTSCSQCRIDEAIIWLRRMMPTLRAREIQSDSTEGIRLMSELKLTTLPAYVFEPTVSQTEFYDQAQALFKDDGGERYVLNPLPLGLPIGELLETPSTSAPNEIVVGPKDAPVTIIEFSDFQCTFCRSFHIVLGSVLEEYKDQVRYVYKHFPLSIHDQAQQAAIAAQCAHDQNKFQDYAKTLFDQQTIWGAEGENALNDEQLSQKFISYATQNKLNKREFEQCLVSGAHNDKIQLDIEEAERFGATGTPTLFINKQYFGGTLTEETLTAVINEELQQAGATTNEVTSGQQ